MSEAVKRVFFGKGSDSLQVEGQDDLLVYRARCCNPIRGEEIIGYVTRGKGVAVHARSCPNVQNLLYESDRRIEVEWAPSTRQYGRRSSQADHLSGPAGRPCDDRSGLLKEFTAIISEDGTNIRPSRPDLRHLTRRTPWRTSTSSSRRARLIGSVLYFMHSPAEVQAWGGGNLTIWLGYNTHFLAPAPLGASSYLTFASVLIPRLVIEKVGLLYEGYFMYWEDADYSLRVTRAGYSLAVAEDTAILHKEGGSAAPRSPVIDRYSLCSGLNFLRRHAAMPAVSMVLFLSTRLAGRLLRREWKHIRALFLAIGDYRRQRGKVYRETL
jgi:hypothetical protein